MFATGFDAMTGALVGVDITGRDGLTLKDEVGRRPATYLGLMTAGFPNFFMITGPGSPSVLSNMAVSIEQHVDWVADCLEDLRAEGFERSSRPQLAEAGWVQHVNDCADITLHPDRQLLVHGRQRARQAARVPALHRRRRRLPAGAATRSSRRTTSGSRCPGPARSSATTA